MDPPPPPPPPTSTAATLPVLAISLLGIVTTAIVLLGYYLFVANCALNRRRQILFPISSRRRRRHAPPPTPHHSPSELRGLEPAAIRAIPIVRYTGGPNECAVCLNEFHVEESLRLLPSCSHTFHIDCIDVWLQSNANCPICRADITAALTFPFPMRVVIEVSGDDAGRKPRGKSFSRVVSKGDEWIDDGREKVQPVRRSFSMDSCLDRELYADIQDILRRRALEGGEGSRGGRMRRSLFSFGHGWSSRSTVLPVQIEAL